MFELDKTRIAIRERSYVDILDLALRVTRVYAWPLLLAFSLGIVPLMLLNSWLLADFAELDFEIGFPAEYMFYMTLLVLLETPLATAPATLYLGKALFTERPDAGEIAREFRQSLGQLLLYQVLLRIRYLRWSYLSEVILLDRNPMRKKSPGGESTLSRSRVLHRRPAIWEGISMSSRWQGGASSCPADGRAGDLVTQAFRLLVVGGPLLASIWLSICFARVMLIGQWQWAFDRPMFTFYFPLALWIVVSYFTVVRFLSYLDLRIRREGWEVELAMRAERRRLARQWR